VATGTGILETGRTIPKLYRHQIRPRPPT